MFRFLSVFIDCTTLGLNKINMVRALLLFLITIPNIAFAIKGFTAEYIFVGELHENAREQSYSDLKLSINDQNSTRGLSYNYDLQSDLVYDHRYNVDNIQWIGDLNSVYQFSNTFSWVLNAELSEIALPSTNQIDLINSQTHSSLKSGFQFEFDEQIRGSLVVGVYTDIHDYEESNLDGRDDTFIIDYSYPISQISEIGLRYSIVDVVYDDAFERLNDVRNDSIRLEYTTNFSSLGYSLFASQNQLDYTNRDLTEDISGYGVTLSYHFNSRSSVLVNVGKGVEHSFSVNTNLADPRNPLMTSGVVENLSFSIQYDYSTRFRSIRLRTYKNEMNDVDRPNQTENLDGFILNIDQIINEKVTGTLYHHQYINEVNNLDFESTVFRIDYIIQESREMKTSINIETEYGDDNGVSLDDNMLQLEVAVKLY